MPKSKLVNLGPYTLGPNFSTHTAQTLYDYISSLKLTRSMNKIKLPPKPRIKKTTLTHSVLTPSSKCVLCNKKPRNPLAKCPGKPAPTKSLSSPENVTQSLEL